MASMRFVFKHFLNCCLLIWLYISAKLLNVVLTPLSCTISKVHVVTLYSNQ